MGTLLTVFGAKFLALAAGAIATVVALAAAWFGAKQGGKKDQQNADMRKQLQDVQAADDVVARDRNLSDDAVAQRLREQYSTKRGV